MFWKISLSLLALLSLSAPAGATVIYVSGDQTGTWAADTVIVTAEVRVPPGQSLTIIPGVEVLFSVYCKLIVDNGATLRAVGTPADSIRFDVLPPNVNWHGVRFLSASDSSRLEYCILTHGKATGSVEDRRGGAIYCTDSSPIISHNTISGNSALYGQGGGLYCSGSSSIISYNLISANQALHPETGGMADGAGLYCAGSNATICFNTISGNIASGSWSADGGGIFCSGGNTIISCNFISANQVHQSEWGGSAAGGGIYCPAGSTIISNNTISGNSASGQASRGSGISCSYSSPTITGNTITGNIASCEMTGIDACGSGISCFHSSPTIKSNTISGNSAVGLWSKGGGIFLADSRPAIIGNSISGNSASGYQSNGGGIYCMSNSNPTVDGNTIINNSTSINGYGGGIYSSNSSPNLINCILWANSQQQFYVSGGSPQINYSDIQGGYAGTGNIAIYPAFVDTAQDDYRLHWGSPCIDTGDPNPIYNDPDGTRADMGAWYYDQTMPMRILLTPYNQPIQIPASGGSFQYAIQATNIASSTLLVPLWCNLTLPNGTTFGPVLGPVRISLGSGQTISRLRTQNISAHAPGGLYHYNAFAVAVGDTSEDSFTFTKLGAGDWGLGAGDWTNTGESFEGQEEAVLIHPSSFILQPSHPNPFNPTTAISFELRDASYVSLRVYDSAGRLVTTLVNGWRDASDHQITFDGSGLPSGIYFAKLVAGDYSQVQKLILLK